MKHYAINQVFDSSCERPAPDCPTYLDRSVHAEFKILSSQQKHIVLYGASRQGKSWLIAKYCPSAIRIGCMPNSTIESINKLIVASLGIQPVRKQRTTSDESSETNEVTGSGGVDFLGLAKTNLSGKTASSDKFVSTEMFEFPALDYSDTAAVIRLIETEIINRFIVLENFHYLAPAVQFELAGALREFLYHGIKFIIIGIWKDENRLSRMVPDVSRSLEPIDIGDWTPDELKRVAISGSQALNITLSETVLDFFSNNCGRNIGIFIELLFTYCRLSGIFETQTEPVLLDTMDCAKKAATRTYSILLEPIIERIDTLAESRPGEKGLRYYVVRAILDIIASSDQNQLTTGIPCQYIIKQIAAYNEENFADYHIRRQLTNLHVRENPNRPEASLLPLFYYHSGKDCIYIVESSIIGATTSGSIDLRSTFGPKARYVGGVKE